MKGNKGLTIPGSNYIGPGNDINRGPPTNEADRIARTHDIAYSNAKTQEDVYEADRTAIGSFGKDFIGSSSGHALAGAAGLGIKHVIERVAGVQYPRNLPTRESMAPGGGWKARGWGNNQKKASSSTYRDRSPLRAGEKGTPDEGTDDVIEQGGEDPIDPMEEELRDGGALGVGGPSGQRATFTQELKRSTNEAYAYIVDDCNRDTIIGLGMNMFPMQIYTIFLWTRKLRQRFDAMRSSGIFTSWSWHNATLQLKNMTQYIYATIPGTQTVSNLHVKDGHLNYAKINNKTMGGPTVTIDVTYIDIESITERVPTAIGIAALDAMDFIRIAKDTSSEPDQNTLDKNQFLFELKRDDNLKATPNNTNVYVHQGLVDKTTNYTGSNIPSQGAPIFKGFPYAYFKDILNADMATIDDRLLRDRGEINLEQAAHYDIDVPIPQGKMPMIIGYYNIYVKVADSTLVKTVISLVPGKDADGIKCFPVQMAPYAMYKVITLGGLSSWQCMAAPSYLLPSVSSEQQYLLMPGLRGPGISYDIINVARKLDQVGNPIATFISCVTSYKASIQFHRDSNADIKPEQPTSYGNTRGEKMTLNPSKRIALPLESSNIVLNL